MRRPQSLRQPVRRHAASLLRIIAGSAYVPSELLSLFERVKRGIRGSARETRTENFLRYAEEHPEEVLAALDDKTEQVIRDLERQQREVTRQMRRPPKYTPAQLADVPF